MDMNDKIVVKGLLNAYPFNFAVTVFGEDAATRILVPEFLNAIKTLSPEDQQFIDLRYRQKLKIQQVMSIMGFKNMYQYKKALSRVSRQTRDKSKVKRFQMVSQAKFDNMQTKLTKEITYLKYRLKLKSMDDNQEDIPKDDMDLSLIVLKENGMLDERSCNCLLRAEIDNLMDLTMLHEDQLLKIRNLGIKSAGRITRLLHLLGLELASDNYKAYPTPISSNADKVDIANLNLPIGLIIKLYKRDIYTVADLIPLATKSEQDIDAEYYPGFIYYYEIKKIRKELRLYSLLKDNMDF